MKDADLIQRVYREFAPAPIPPERQAALYVNLDEVRGHSDVVSRLAKKIRLAEGKPTGQVLAGHKGSGKSTELFRLMKELESGPNPLFVVYVWGSECLDLNDIGFPDVLIARVRQLAAQLKDRLGISLKPGYFKDRFDGLKKLFFSEVSLESFDLQVEMTKLGFKLKASPDARAELRKLFEPDTSNWLDAANDIVGQAVVTLEKAGYRGLVVLVDDLDKMVVREQAGASCTTDEYLFVNRAAQLTAFRCHVVYTMPLSLVYSHHEQAIKNSYAGHVPVVPMTKIADRPPKSTPYQLGIAKLRDVIGRRLHEAGAEKDQVFADTATCDKLIALSGGQPTEIMTLVREAIIAHDLPIDGRSLERAEIEGRREYARQLRADHWLIIEEVGKNGTFQRTLENERAIRELLNSRAILQYDDDNGEEWYGLNPMVAVLGRPR